MIDGILKSIYRHFTMKHKNPFVIRIFAVLSLSITSSSAELLSFTSFEGTASEPVGDVGFPAAIRATTAAGAAPSVASYNAGDQGTLPSAYTFSGFTNVGNFITTQGSPLFSTLATSIPNQTPTVRYFSYLYSLESSGNGANGGGLSFFNGATEIFQIGIAGGSKIRINPLSGTTTTTEGTFITGTEVLWITGKIETAAGNDTVSIRFYKGDDMKSLTEDWTGPQSSVNSTSAFAGPIDTIRFNSPTGTLNPPNQFDEFRFGNTYESVAPGSTPAPSSALADFRSVNSLASDGSQDLLTPANDGVSNLLKFAFNMLGPGPGQEGSLNIPNVTLFNGTAGLPVVGKQAGTGKLEITYLRRKAAGIQSSGVSYSVEFSSNLTDFAVDPSSTEIATSIDPDFESVVVTDSVSPPGKRFARVRVTAP